MDKIDERIELYSRLYQKACQKAQETNPENAKELASKIFAEVAKDLRSELICRLKNGENSKSGNSGNNATRKQIAALQRFGVKGIPEELSKAEAGAILGSLVDLTKYGNKETLEEEIQSLNERWKRTAATAL